jgi:hypothetical protein
MNSITMSPRFVSRFQKYFFDGSNSNAGGGGSCSFQRFLTLSIFLDSM